MYYAIYKCRLCGEEFNQNISERTELEIKRDIEYGQDYLDASDFVDAFEETSFHKCKDNSLGFSDFIGFGKLED